MSDENLNDAPVEDLQVKRQENPVKLTIGSKEFCNDLLKEFLGNKVWRTSKSLAEKLNVDPVELDTYLRKQNSVCCKSSKDEGIFLYALVNRLTKEKPVDEKVQSALRPVVSEDDRYAIASLHASCVLLEAALQKYAMRIHERNSEAFTQLVEAKNKLEAGIALYGNKLKADMTKLLKV